jgi:hypothetical protein
MTDLQDWVNKVTGNNDNLGLNAKNAMLCWETGGEVRVDPVGSRKADHLPNSALGVFAHVRKMNFEQRQALVFITALYLIICEACNPINVHRALLRLEEYRTSCFVDIPSVATLARAIIDKKVARAWDALLRE